MIVLRLLGFLWAFPCTLIGLLLAAVTRSRYEFSSQYALYFIMSYSLIPKKFVAITFGNVVLCKKDFVTECSREQVKVIQLHEEEHCRQFMVFGVLFWVVYGVDFLIEFCMCRDVMTAYHNVGFEVAARQASVNVLQILPKEKKE